MIAQVVEKIREADLVLFGIGEEMDTLSMLRREESYRAFAEKMGGSWALPYVEKVMLEGLAEKRSGLYRQLAESLDRKDYFFVSLCEDGLIRETGLDEGRIVEPCGGYKKLQCSGKCSTKLYDLREDVLLQIRAFVEGKVTKEELRQPLCPLCGQPLVFNKVDSPNYVEEGYLDQWAAYKKWLQGTVNKKVCLLELGVGMKYPTVIRWPFEKITYFNQKATLFRIHSSLYQITAEIRERGYGICRKPKDFLEELSVALGG